MRIMFSAVPVAGHVLPLLPMAAAARDDGHEVAVLTAAGLRDLVAPFHVLPAGPPIQDQIAETVRRTGRRWAGPGPEAAELFSGTRVDVTFDEALGQAQTFTPELIVCDPLDYVGPTVAAALGVAWAHHGISGGLPEPFLQALRERWVPQLRERRLQIGPRLGYVDPYPDLLRATEETTAADRVPVRFLPFDREGACYDPPVFEDESLPRVLLTLGTSVEDPDMGRMLATSLADAGHNVVVTEPEPGDREPLPRTRHVGFVPLARVLPDVDLVMSAAGTGTLLSSLAAGLPLVLAPLMADQPFNAARAARVGTARVITRAADAGTAAREVLTDPAYRQAAERVRSEIDARPHPAQVLRHLLALR